MPAVREHDSHINYPMVTLLLLYEGKCQSFFWNQHSHTACLASQRVSPDLPVSLGIISLGTIAPRHRQHWSAVVKNSCLWPAIFSLLPNPQPQQDLRLAWNIVLRRQGTVTQSCCPQPPVNSFFSSPRQSCKEAQSPVLSSNLEPHKSVRYALHPGLRVTE